MIALAGGGVDGAVTSEDVGSGAVDEADSFGGKSFARSALPASLRGAGPVGSGTVHEWDSGTR